MMDSAVPQYSPELKQLLEHIKHIPADDELELRVAVHDLKHYTEQSAATLKNDQGYEAILRVCADIIHQSGMQYGKQAPYIQNLHALLYDVLPKLIEPQSKLDLHGLKLHGCQLAHIEISQSTLQYIDISSSNLSHANLHHSDLSYSNAMSADLHHSNLYACSLSDSDLSWADLSHADLHLSQLIDAQLSEAILNHADASYAVFSGSDLSSAKLDCADLSFSNLFAVNLQHCRLHGTDLRGTGITEQRLHDVGMHVHSDSKTLWGDENDCDGQNPLHKSYYPST